MKKRVKIFLLGGTISMTANSEGHAEPRLSASDLVDLLPKLKSIPEIDAVTLMMKPSASITWEDMRFCYNAIQQAFADDYDGVVVIQGTDTLEEVAFILDVLSDDARPIVVTGAMRSAYLPGADGAANLSAAISVAGSDQARNLGSLVVMNDLIHAARYVIKAHTSSTNAFQSRLTGPLGFIHEGVPHFITRLNVSSPTFLLPAGKKPEVGIFTFVFGQSWPFEAMYQYDAVVLELAGSGHVAGDDVHHFKSLAEKIPVVFASRVRDGMVMSDTYGYPGSECELIDAGLIPSGQYDSAKAQILITLALWNKKAVNAELFQL